MTDRRSSATLQLAGVPEYRPVPLRSAPPPAIATGIEVKVGAEFNTPLDESPEQK